MRKIKWTPILVLFPILIIAFILYMIYYSTWTPFSLPAIFVFIFVTCVTLFVDRILILWIKLKVIWFSEIVIITILYICLISK